MYDKHIIIEGERLVFLSLNIIFFSSAFISVCGFLLFFIAPVSAYKLERSKIFVSLISRKVEVDKIITEQMQLSSLWAAGGFSCPQLMSQRDHGRFC